jgi:hypothetical protein
MAKRKKKSSARGARCTTKLITIKRKSGKVIAQFKGRTGPGCGPRKKPSTRHLARYKKAFARQAKACKGKSLSQFRSCMHRLKGAVPAY